MIDFELRRHNNAWLHCLSIWSAPFLVWSVTGVQCLLPMHNALKEPQYWYEHQLILAFGLLPLFLGHALITVIYWSNFSFDKKWTTYIQTISIGTMTYSIVLTTYHMIWTHYLDLVLPLPLNLYLTASSSYVAMTSFVGYMCVFSITCNRFTYQKSFNWIFPLIGYTSPRINYKI